MSKLRDAAQQALEALIAATPVKAKDPQMQADAIVALRAALAEQPAEQKPIAPAMATVIAAMQADPAYAWSWHCNIAMAFVDAGGDYYTANQGAARFMKLLANVEPAHDLPAAPQPAIPQGYKLVPVALLERLAPEDPMNQDEMGGCVWCAGNGGKKYGDAGRDPEDHAADCPWVEARAMLNAATEEPQPAKREPLTWDELDVLWEKQRSKPFKSHGEDLMEFARAIERAHGIGEHE